MKFLFVDCETTDLNPISGGLIQVAGIVEIDGNIVEEFNFKAKPYKGEFVSKKALEINGVTLEELRTWPEPAVMYRQVKSVLGKYVDKFDKSDKFYAVGQNVGFDLEFLKFLFVKNGDHYFGSYIHYNKIDLIPVSLVMKLAGRIDVPNMKLESVMAALEMGKQSHDALDDIRATRQIFYKYVEWVKVGATPV